MIGCSVQSEISNAITLDRRAIELLNVDTLITVAEERVEMLDAKLNVGIAVRSVSHDPQASVISTCLVDGSFDIFRRMQNVAGNIEPFEGDGTWNRDKWIGP